jgi:hypothetical protein
MVNVELERILNETIVSRIEIQSVTATLACSLMKKKNKEGSKCGGKGGENRKKKHILSHVVSMHLLFG